MLGLIVTTQIVSYPLFSIIDSKNFVSYHKNYVNKISIIAVPIMILEFILAIVLLISMNIFLTILIFLITILIFLSTFLIQVPIHEKIKHKSNKYLFDMLVKTNLIRTSLWFLKCVLSFNLLYKELLI